MSQTSSVSDGMSGCQVGLNHGCDEFRVWLNPVVVYGVVPNTKAADWFGYGVDLADGAVYPDAEVVQVRMDHLQDPGKMYSGEVAAFERTWAPINMDGSGPGLTQDDFNAIVATDPFSNPNYTLQYSPGATTTTDGRFTTVSASEVLGSSGCSTATVPYDVGTSYTCSVGYTTTATTKENASTSYKSGFSVDNSFSGTSFGATIGQDVKTSGSLTTTQSFDQATNNSHGQTATVDVYGFPEGTNYSGPVTFVLWQDNLYGTFMFYHGN